MSSLSGIKSWSSEPMTPRDFLRRYTLPQLVRIHETTAAQRATAPAKLDLRQPLLLYKAYTCRKVHARSLDRDRDGGMTAVGPPLVIPDSYSGWLALITDDGRTAGYFTTVGEVALAEVPYFLTRDQVTGYRVVNSKEGKPVYAKTLVSSGEVLRFLGAYEDVSVSSIIPVHPRYAKCVTQKKEVIFLPYSNTGRFFSVARQKSQSANHVYHLSSLVEVNRLPVTVRVVSGALPKTSCNFTGVLRLECVDERQVILACTLRSKEPMLLEVDTDSDFSFLRAQDDQKARASKMYLRMLRHCGDEGDRWKQQIKIAHHVFPDGDPSMTSSSSSSSRRRHCGKTSAGRRIDVSCISPGYEDEDSAVRSSATMKSMSSVGSKKSTSSSSSNFFRRFWLLHRSKPFQMKPAGGGTPMDHGGRARSFNTADTHLYESVKNSTRWTRYAGSSMSTEILDDDGYVTSDFEEAADSTYDSVC